MKKKAVDELRDSALYSQAEASRYLQVPYSTLRYWAVGESTNRRTVKAVIDIPKGSSRLSFNNLVELHILASLRKSHQIDFPRIREALDYVRKKLHSKRPLLEESFETDGVDIFVKRFGGLINVSQQGQQAMLQVLQDSLRRVERDSCRIPIKLFPYTHSKAEDSPKVICMTPTLFSGRPVINGTGVSTAIVAERYKAGDSINLLAKDYAQPAANIEEAIRCELQIAA